MIPTKAPAGMVCHLIWQGEEIAGEGNELAYIQPGCTVEWFASRRDREEMPEVDQWRRHRLGLELQAAAASPADHNKTLEYMNKRIEAERWLDAHPVEDFAELPPFPSSFEHLRPEVEVCGCTPFEAATAIMGKVLESAASARGRIEMRERGRSLTR